MITDLAIHVAGQRITAVEIAGNMLGLATVLLGTRRTIWTWPVQFAGNVLLLVVFARAHLGGSVTRQAALAALSAYGWWRWAGRDRAVRVASWPVRVVMVVGYAGLVPACIAVLSATSTSRAPWPDGYVLAGSLLATLLLATMNIEIWPTWIAVNLVGIPLCLSAHLYVTAAVYVVFTVLAVNGWWRWARTTRRTNSPPRPAPPLSARLGTQGTS